MKITLKDLKDKKAYIAWQEWFVYNFDKRSKVDIQKLKNKLIKSKNGGFLCWLYETYNLSGYVKIYWDSYHIQRECYYKNGELDGESIIYWYNGNIAIKCFYKNGIRYGEYIEYNKNGSIVEKSYYENGVKIK